MTTRRLFLLSALALAWLLARQWEQRPITHSPGILAGPPPIQTALARAQPVLIDDYALTPRARFELRARVLSTQRYRLGREAHLSPVDLALGWGPMSDQSVLNLIDIRQSGRWYRTRYALPPPIAESDIIIHSGNMHMIPVSADVADRLKRLRAGELVRIKGQLVDVDHDSGWAWRTSLRRDDTGAGACEIVLVESLWLD